MDEQVKALKYYQFIVENVDDPLWQVKSLEKIADINFSFSKNFIEAVRAYTIWVQMVVNLADKLLLKAHRRLWPRSKAHTRVIT